MLKSMTGYGRASSQTALGRFVAEVFSVNRKFLELNIFLPKEFSRFDADARKIISSAVVRGQVTLKLYSYFEERGPMVVKPNLPFARQLKVAWDQIADECGVDPIDAFQLQLLQGETGLLLYGEEMQDESEYRQAICETIELALQAFLEMRSREGAALQRDISGRLDNLQEWMEGIQQLAGRATERYREKLKQRIEEILQGPIENEERIYREVALFADRVDITEEITRFLSHVSQFRSQLISEERGVGKTLDFLLQEMGREINTIGSKSADVEVSKRVIEIKSELERIREQLQNVE